MAQVGFRLRAISELSSLLVLALLRGCFSGFSSFPPSTKSNISKSQFAQVRGTAAKVDVASSLNTANLFNVELSAIDC